jgi:hypothetical protein
MEKSFERTKMGICYEGSRGRTFSAVDEEEEERAISVGSTLRINCTISSILE